jgi:hypothetical protein
MKGTKLEFTVGPGGWLQAVARRGDGPLEAVFALRLRRDAEGAWEPEGSFYVMPVTAENIRAIPLRRILVAVAASEALQARLAARLGEKVPEVGSIDFHKSLSGFVLPELPPLVRPAGRNLSDEFYAAVADRYRDAAARALNPRTAIAEAAGVSTDVAGRWVREARKRDLLPPTRTGKVKV